MIQPLKECHQFSTVSSSVSDFCPPFQPFANPSYGLKKSPENGGTRFKSDFMIMTMMMMMMREFQQI